MTRIATPQRALTEDSALLFLSNQIKKMSTFLVHIRSPLEHLVRCVAPDLSDENFGLSVQFAERQLRFHKYLGVNEHRVEEIYEG